MLRLRRQPAEAHHFPDGASELRASPQASPPGKAGETTRRESVSSVHRLLSHHDIHSGHDQAADLSAHVFHVVDRQVEHLWLESLRRNQSGWSRSVCVDRSIYLFHLFTRFSFQSTRKPLSTCLAMSNLI